MTRATLTVNSKYDRERAAKWVMQAPAGTRIEFKQVKRSLAQNDRMWAMLTDVAVQLPWHGVKLTADEYKLIFLDALKRELRIVPNIDGTGFVNLGRSSSDLSKNEMSDLIELIFAFGAKHGVTFHDPESSQQSALASASPETPEPAALRSSPQPDAAAGSPMVPA